MEGVPRFRSLGWTLLRWGALAAIVAGAIGLGVAGRTHRALWKHLKVQ